MSRILIVPQISPAVAGDRLDRLALAGRSGGSRPARPDRPAKPGRAGEEDDRPPLCPICHKRLVILAMHPGRDADGRPIRRQLWGCPRGHATAYRVGGVFGPIDILEDLDDE